MKDSAQVRRGKERWKGLLEIKGRGIWTREIYEHRVKVYEGLDVELK